MPQIHDFLLIHNQGANDPLILNKKISVYIQPFIG